MTFQKLLIVALLVAYASADVSELRPSGVEANAKILKQELDVGVDGQYLWGYETENGIAAHEHGELTLTAEGTPAVAVQGEAKWISPDGETVQLSYVADENGYQPEGSHIPTPPPIPQAIVRALEYIRAHPPPPETPSLA